MSTADFKIQLLVFGNISEMSEVSQQCDCLKDIDINNGGHKCFPLSFSIKFCFEMFASRIGTFAFFVNYEIEGHTPNDFKFFYAEFIVKHNIHISFSS